MPNSNGQDRVIGIDRGTHVAAGQALPGWPAAEASAARLDALCELVPSALMDLDPATLRILRVNQRMRELLDAPIDAPIDASIAVAERDLASGRLTRVNASFCRLVGYSEAQLLTMTIEDLTPPEELDTIRRRLAPLASGSVTEYTAMKELLCSNGSRCWVLGSISRLPGTGGTPDRLITVYINVNEVVSARMASSTHGPWNEAGRGATGVRSAWSSAQPACATIAARSSVRCSCCAT